MDNNNYLDELADSQFLIGNDLMAAPILEKGATSRKVYFTTMDWYNLHDGTRYHPGTSMIENVKVTDKVPLFIREGAMILTQNTDDVLSTKDLQNNFQMVAGFHYNKQKSNETFSYYNAAGAHISILNYND